MVVIDKRGDFMKEINKSFEWFRKHLLQDILPNWLYSSAMNNGFFVANLDRKWNRFGDEIGTLVTQSRLLFNFSKGYEITGRREYRRAVKVGAHFLLDYFQDKEYGGWFWSCRSDGRVVDSRKEGYGHAFAIFGLSHAYQTTGDKDFKKAAQDTWQIIETRFKDKYDGFTCHMTRDFKDCDSVKSEGLLMHLFEALLTLGEIEGASEITDEAAKVANFVFTNLFRDEKRYLPEMYTLDWKELPENQGGFVSIGHAFEWAYLLSRGVEKGLPESYLCIAERLLSYGLKVGYDSEVGGIFSLASSEGKIISKAKGWWEQCEAIRAFMNFAILRGRDDLWEPFQKTIDFVKNHLLDKEYGGWYPGLDSNGSPTSQEKGHVGGKIDLGIDYGKVDYHVVGMCSEALRLEEERGNNVAG